MSDAIQITVGILFLILVFILTRYGITWRIKRAGRRLIEDLERLGAQVPGSAVELPYLKKQLFHIGMRDFKPTAMQSLIEGCIVGMTGAGKYYLKMKPINY
ncbi:MAG: hypothetical protein NTY44_02010 [Deltaproteobacteria bacterium]|nr:hypothetical protein [Deltaproteobacteria bacterium]